MITRTTSSNGRGLAKKGERGQAVGPRSVCQPRFTGPAPSPALFDHFAFDQLPVGAFDCTLKARGANLHRLGIQQRRRRVLDFHKASSRLPPASVAALL